jgi:hypothetical protein
MLTPSMKTVLPIADVDIGRNLSHPPNGLPTQRADAILLPDGASARQGAAAFAGVTGQVPGWRYPYSFG